MKLLQGVDQDELLNNHIGIPLNQLWVDGVNGRHLCLILRFLGPRVGGESHSTGYYEYQLPQLHRENPTVYNDAALQVVRGLDFLHKKGLCYEGKILRH